MLKNYKIIALFLMLLSTALFAQNYTLSGKVTDASTGEALIGANVYLVGLNQGVVTDFYGNYQLSNIPRGNFSIKVSYVGYKSETTNLDITTNMNKDFNLKSTAVELKGVVVEVNRAVERETPVTFTEIDRDALQAKYNTQDVPDLLNGVPGVYTNTGGLGESEIFVRGFDAEQVLILINGVPVNDPESQRVYWSNWTGLSSAASSVQVQKGAGASLVGSGALGGSVNIETGLYSKDPQVIVKGSAGIYSTQGIDGGIKDGKVATGTGGFETIAPSNQNFYIEYTSGQMYDGKLNLKLSYERKAGDSYITGTNYNGHAYYIGLQSILGDHLLELTAHGAPQRHNQARTMQDIDLLKTLGREYNRYNHPYQENYYFKPQFELHWDWSISKQQTLSTNAFVTTGIGGGRYLRNDYFDVNSGEATFKAVSEGTTWYELGRNARWVYENTGVALEGFDPNGNVYTYGAITDTVSRSGRPIIPSQYSHSWRNDSHNDHFQFGLNTSYSHKINDYVAFVVGGEVRNWEADHYAESFDFRLYDPATGNVKTYHEVQQRYNNTGKVTNFSGFGRLLISPIENLIISADGQYASSIQEMVENPIEIFDFNKGEFTGKSFYATKNSGEFTDDEYKETFSFFTPKFGARYNVSNALTIFANWGQAKKEPKTGDWYDRTKGPKRNNIKEETMTNMEAGVGYRHPYFAIEANYYISDFEDKIESVTKQDGERETINAGAAKHSGFELSANARYKKIDGNISLTIGNNEWEEMNVQKIFGVDAADVVGKKVPFSPQTMYNFGLGYSPISGLRIGLSANAWADYYADYANTAKLDDFMEINAAISYGFEFNGSNVNLRLDAYNLANKEQYQRASYGADYGRNDDLNGQYKMYILQSRLRTFFLTASISI